MASTKTYDVGIIGYGFSAKIFHIPFVTALPSNFRLKAVVQRSPTQDDDASRDWPDISVHKDSKELVADPNIDVVIVTTVPQSHYELVKQALEAGKHVVVEKPFVPTSAEATELMSLAASKSLILTVYQNRRFDSDFLMLRAVLPDLGTIAEFETHFDRHRPEIPVTLTRKWKQDAGPGHGVVYDLGTHLIDQVVALFGAPDRVTGFLSSREGATTEDSMTALLHYDAGKDGRRLPLLATVKASVVSAEQDQLRYWVRGTEGSWRKLGMDVQEEQLIAGLRPDSPQYGIDDQRLWGTLTSEGGSKVERLETRGTKTYVEFYRRFATALDGDKGALPVHPQEAIDLIRIIELVRQSSTEGRSLSFRHST